MESLDIKDRLAQELDFRIANYVSRGNMEALVIIRKYHMTEISQIRDYMMPFVRDSFNNPRELNRFFYSAVSELNIKLEDLLVPGVTVVSEKEDNVSIAL